MEWSQRSAALNLTVRVVAVIEAGNVLTLVPDNPNLLRRFCQVVCGFAKLSGIGSLQCQDNVPKVIHAAEFVNDSLQSAANSLYNAGSTSAMGVAC